MSKYRQKSIEVEAIRLEYHTLIQTPVGAMSAEPGDYLETIRAEGKVHQRIVPGWAFDASYELVKKSKHKFVTGSLLGDVLLTPLPDAASPMTVEGVSHG